ncbi:MAG: Hpt domain-containing protein [Gammaproteobacteria bacterium]
MLADFENDQDIVDTLFALFKENLADQVAEINRSFDNKDRKAVADTMHAMKGASASMRANTLSQLAAQAQAHFLSADSQRDSDVIEAIKAEVDRVNAFLEGA